MVADDTNYGGGDTMEEMPRIWERLVYFLKMHDKFYQRFCETHQIMYFGDGPLPVPTRHYLAVMAAARHHCRYLIDAFKFEFLRTGGDSAWLQGISAVPEKIRNFDKLNRILAARPWLVNCTELQELSAADTSDHWSLSEIIQGAVIVSHVHALCSFIFACSIRGSCLDGGDCDEVATATKVDGAPNQQELCHSDSGHFDGQQNHHQLVDSHVVGTSNGVLGVDNVIRVLHELNRDGARCSQVENLQAFLSVNEQISEIVTNGSACSEAVNDECSNFTDDLSFQYKDFVLRDNPSATRTLKIHECTWEDHGYAVISQFYSSLSHVLDRKFSMIQSFTYNTIGKHRNVDTSKYRVAIWNYIQSLYGIRHDDYNYEEVNKLLSRQIKTYIKTICCFPERVPKYMASSALADFDTAEKVHFNILFCEARLQVELLYFLRAVIKFMK